MASLECAHEYQNALEEGPVRPGDLLNVPAGFLNKLWVDKHGMPTSTVVVATVVRVQADGGQAGVSAVIEQYPYVLRIPLISVTATCQVAPGSARLHSRRTVHLLDSSLTDVIATLGR